MIIKPHCHFAIAAILLLMIGTSSCGAVTPIPAPTNTPTPISVESEIKQSLQDNNCKPPCFLGVVPERTTIEELEAIFAQFGAPLQKSYSSYSTLRDPFSEQLIPYITFSIRDNKVHSMSIDIEHNNKFLLSLYSPINVLRRFNTPSKVEFGMTSINRSVMRGFYQMIFYYDDLDFVIHYFGLEVEIVEAITICPNTDVFNLASVSLGKDPDSVMLNTFNFPLEEVTPFNLESFQKYMLGPSACFNLKGKVWQN